MNILLRLSTLFLLALAVLLSTVSARPQVNNVYKRKASPTGTEKYLTNAARMAAGLGPLTPRNLFNPTRVKGVLLSPIHLLFLSNVSNQLLEMQTRLSLRECILSSLAFFSRLFFFSCSLSGRIKVTQASNGHFIGYVDKNYRPDGRY